MHNDTVFASVAIGAAASLGGMIWPFRRGLIGIAVNLLAGVVGALLAGLFSLVVLPYDTHGDTPARLVFAAIGALAALVAVHAAGSHLGAAQRRSVGMSKAPPHA